MCMVHTQLYSDLVWLQRELGSSHGISNGVNVNTTSTKCQRTLNNTCLYMLMLMLMLRKVW